MMSPAKQLAAAVTTVTQVQEASGQVIIMTLLFTMFIFGFLFK